MNTKSKSITALIISIFSLLMPVICIAYERATRAAQGEKTEEILAGLFIGWIIGFFISIISLLLNRKVIILSKTHNQINIVTSIFSYIGIGFGIFAILFLLIGLLAA